MQSTTPPMTSQPPHLERGTVGKDVDLQEKSVLWVATTGSSKWSVRPSLVSVELEFICEPKIQP